MKEVVFITGASSGIGKATAILLAEKGYCVYGTARNPQESPEKYNLIPMDVRQESSVKEAIKKVMEKEQHIDILINNAGVGITGALEETPIEALENAFQTNFFGAVRVIQAVLPIMRQQRKGFILNITSVAAYMGLPFRGGYSASKGALSLITETLRMETRQFGIKVCTLAPGDVATDIASRRFHTPAQENSPYPQYTASLSSMNQQVDEGADPAILAQKIYQVIMKKSPKVHYSKGKFLETFSIFLKKILPSKYFERLLMNHCDL